MTTFAVQYLENTPQVESIAPNDARAKLRAAFEYLPISWVILGWNLPEPLVKVCKEETVRAGAQFFLWHPLLTGDGIFVPKPEWQTIGWQDEPVPGFRDMPEFTFVCPNKPAVQEAVRHHLRQVIQNGTYDGVFLDRMRFPSPATNPMRWLACFCDDCQRTAAEEGLDLAAVRRRIKQLLATPQRLFLFVQALLGTDSASSDPNIALLNAFLDFRARCISKFIQSTADLIHAEGLAVSLDCFSPALTRMVGQDLGVLDACGEWTKVMTYAHTFGPAGLPFELLELANWLIEKQQISEPQALTWLSQASRLPLPPSCTELRRHGLSSAALQIEMEQARTAGVSNLLAGVELVEIEGIAHHERSQIETDLHTLRKTDIDGLVLSWDLWHIPLERLQFVGAVWR